MNEETDRFHAALRSLHQAAGRPTLSRLVRLGLAQRPPATVTDSTISNWLNGTAVPGPAQLRYFLVLTAFLEGQAAQRAPGRYAPRSQATWRNLLAGARRERDAARGGRPRTGTGGPRPRPEPPGPEPRRAVPRQLPRPAPFLVGRERELAALETARSGPRPPGSPLVVITGPAGSGKTGLALWWLHQLTAEYPDGQLFVDLRGFAQEPPVEPVDALGQLLRATTTGPVPASGEEAAALWRSTTQSRRLILFLDNVRDAGQVRPLLLGSSAALVVVTSRSRLTGLVPDGAVSRAIGPLDASASARLLASVLGEPRVAAEPAAADQLVTHCAGLPLALWITAARLATRPGARLADAIVPLDHAAERLALLHLDSEYSVPAALEASFRSLSWEAARHYRVLGGLPFADFTAEAAGAAVGSGAAAARGAIDELVEYHLLEPAGPGRHRFHDLVRLHARGSGADLARGDGRPLRRVVDWYLATATEAERILCPTHRTLGRDYPEAATALPVPPFHDDGGALLWLRQECPNLMAALRAAEASGWQSTVWQLVDAMWPLFLRLRPYDLWIQAHEVGLEAARRVGDRAAESRMLTSGGVGLRNSGRPEQAIRWFEQALALALAGNEGREAAQALHGLGQSHRLAGRLAEAEALFREALELRTAVGYPRGAALSRLCLGDVALATGRFQEAVGALGQARAELVGLRDPYDAARALALLGRAQAAAGDRGRGCRSLFQALAEFQATGSAHWRAHVLELLGEVADEQGEPDRAAAWYRQALAGYRALQAPDARRVESLLAGPAAGPGAGPSAQ